MSRLYPAVITCIVITAAGCATCPSVAPTEVIVDNPIPVYSCPEPPSLPPLVLPDWPVLPDDPTPEQVKAWYVEMVRVVHVRIDMLRQRVDTLDEMLDAYRQD